MELFWLSHHIKETLFWEINQTKSLCDCDYIIPVHLSHIRAGGREGLEQENYTRPGKSVFYWIDSHRPYRSYFEDFICNKVKDRFMLISVKISTQWETYIFKLALIAVGVSIRTANRVKKCRTHLWASWQWIVSIDNCGNYITLDDAGPKQK